MSTEADIGSVQRELVGGSHFAYWTVGTGEPLIFMHGWPFHSATYHPIVPFFAEHFRCILIDSPGLGLTEWSEDSNFTFTGQVRTFETLFDRLGLDEYSIIAHDTGATIARMLCAENPRLRKFIILNTEIPGERPPWLPLYAKLMRLPGSKFMFRLLLRSQRFLKSSMGFGECYANVARINEQFIAQYVRPLLDDPQRLEGVMRYLSIGLDFRLIDDLRRYHLRIRAPVHMIWGKADPTFPIEGARRMMEDFRNFSGLTEIERGKLLAHEEFPELVASAALKFLRSS
jgi:pimeloyl-ACP methyl ester carboxylesterase